LPFAPDAEFVRSRVRLAEFAAVFHSASRGQRATKLKRLGLAGLTAVGALLWFVARPLLQDYERDVAAQRAIVSELQDLVEACRATNVVNPDLIGKVLVWNMQTDSPSAAQGLLADELRLSSAEDTKRLRIPCTVFMIVAERNREVGTLTGQPLYHNGKPMWPWRTGQSERLPGSFLFPAPHREGGGS